MVSGACVSRLRDTRDHPCAGTRSSKARAKLGNVRCVIMFAETAELLVVYLHPTLLVAAYSHRLDHQRARHSYPATCARHYPFASEA